MKKLLAILVFAASVSHGAVDVAYRYADLIWTGTGTTRVATFGAADVTSGLIARWLMAEGAGTTAADSSGTNTAYFVNDPTWTNRTGRGAIYFDGVNDALRSSTLNLSSTNVITLCFWMNWKTYANNDDMAFEYSANSGTYGGFYVLPNSAAPANGKFAISMGLAGVGVNAGYIERPASNVWNHYAITLNRMTGTNIGIKVYFNGALTNIVQYGVQSLSNNFSATSIGLNFMSRNGANLYGNGQLQDVRVYNRAVTSNEAWTIWNATK